MSFHPERKSGSLFTSLTLADDPPPRLARFLKHPAQISSNETKHSTSNYHSNYDTDHLDIELNEASTDSFLRRRQPSDFNEDKPNLIPEETSNHDTIPRSTALEPTTPHHSPVPASKVFARNAPPLHLPNLDDYISSLPAPHFSAFSNASASRTKMFPPMNLLENSSKTIEDLERNEVLAPPWTKRTTIFKGLAGITLGLAGSSLLSTYYSLQGLSNTLQIFALIVSTILHLGAGEQDKWRQLFLGTIPNILAFNFTSSVIGSLLLLMTTIGLTAPLLYHFRRSISHCDRYDAVEGLWQIQKGSQWGLVVATFLLTVIYLPLSTLAVHVVVWSQDLWVVPNPYTNATSNPPTLPPLRPADQFRDPLDFCWTTTMRRNEINWVPLFLLISLTVIVFFTIWFPLTLHQVIKRTVPKVDPFTELGRPRSKSDMDREYERLLDRDSTPFAFLYATYRRGWGTYQSTFLLAKLSALIVIALIDPDNCLFRSVSRTAVLIARQVILLVSMIAFFVLQCIMVPFLDPVDNANEWVSRLNYVATAAIALGVAANMPGQTILNGPVLYATYGVTYSLSAYFLIINTSIVHRFVKRITNRIDFSIDIFSPRIDLSPSSPHIKRRIWQETITTLFFTSSDCKIPEKQHMRFAQARNSEYPPYLLDFCGTPGERHVENLKILREVGLAAYNKAVALTHGPDHSWFHDLAERIQKHFIGPDCYWKNPTDSSAKDRLSYFGTAWWIPFPPTLVLRYDDGSLAVIRDVEGFRSYTAQNSSRDVLRRKGVRMSLRALEGQLVQWPYEHVEPVGVWSSWCTSRKGYKSQTCTQFHRGLLQIRRRGHLLWEGLQLGSGFNVDIQYSRYVAVDGVAIGLVGDCELTPLLARFLALNESLINRRLDVIENSLHRFRAHYFQEFQAKIRVLSYRFLSFVYNHPRDFKDIMGSCIEFERDPRVRSLLLDNETAFNAANERLSTVTKTEASTWWYLFWDDFWRRNYTTINSLSVHAQDFNPHYPTCIAYNPLPRSALEMILVQRGLMSKPPNRRDTFSSGFLNKIYLRLNEAAFHGSSRAIMFHIDDNTNELDMEEVDILTQGGTSTLGTGGGTDHDDVSIRARPAYHWEGIMDEPWRKGWIGTSKWFAKLGVWIGLTPFWNASFHSTGLALDVRLDNGRFVLVNYKDKTVPGT